MTLHVFSPLGRDPADVAMDPSPRLRALDGKRIGLLDNSKQNADALLVSLGEQLASRYGAQVRLWQKGEGSGAAGPVPDPMATEIAGSVDAVLVALGD